MPAAAPEPQRDGAARPAGGDARPAPGMNGARSGTSGAARLLRAADLRDLWRGALWTALFGVAIVAVNSFTVLADNDRVRSWEPWVWEISSYIGAFCAIWAPWLATALAPPDDSLTEGWRPRLRFIAVHGVGLLTYAAVHVAVFVLLRQAAYAVMDSPYEFGDRFFYELRKDAITYGLLVGVFWLAGALRRRRDEPVRPVSFDIRDGARLIRTPLSEILAVSSAGNYVEFWLADGRRPLMRATLAAIEVELERFGFVRAHRSWLVNAERVTGLKPEGSGDWTVELGAVEAPLSRRYPKALERLRDR